MSDIAILKEMLKEEATVSLEGKLEGKRERHSVTLGEPQGNYSIKIDGMPKPDEVIVVKADIFSGPREVFIGSKGECKRADFVIIADTPTEKIILYIEMKLGKNDAKSIIKQLKGAQCFVAYCREIGQSFWNQRDFLKDYSCRFVSIQKISISKKTTRFTAHPVHDQPDKMLKLYHSRSFQFNSLV
jgi:hypothetical protein